MNIKKRFKFNDKSTMLLFCLAAAQLSAITIYNLFRLKYVLDYDSAPALTQTFLTWNQGTLFIKDWWYTTNLGWDTSIPLASLIYGISHNIYFSFGLADNIILYAFIYIYYRICRRIRISAKGTFVVFILLLTPYSIGQLDYMNMLFASQASYNIRALLTMAMISIMLEFYAGQKFKDQWALCTIFTVLLFISSCSSSLYALISCVFPILVFVFINFIREDNFSFKSLQSPLVYFPVLSGGVAALGIVFSKYINITNGADSKSFTTGVHFGDNFISCLVGIFELLGGIKSDKNVAVLSAEGISLMLKLIVIFIILFSFIFICKKNFRYKENNKFVEIALTLILINLGILIFADTTYGSVSFEYRYLIIPVLPMFIFSGCLSDLIDRQNNKSLKFVYFAGIITICFILNAGLFSYAYGINDGYDELYEIKTVIDSNDIGLVNVVHDSTIQNSVDGRIFKTMDADSQFIISDGTNVDWWAMSDTNLENTYYSGKTAILTQASIFDSLPDYYKSHAILSKEFSYHNYNLYVLDTNRFDYYSGFPKNENTLSIDFPYSYMYDIQNGFIDTNGIFHSDGTSGTVITGTAPAYDGNYSVSLHYSMADISGTSGEFIIKRNEELISSVPLRSGSSSAVINNIDITDFEDLELTVDITSGTIIQIKYIEYIRN